MKKEVRQLRQKAINGLVLSIDHFNRPWDRGRTEGVLIMLDHSFEMLLKASIRHRQGKIRRPREKQTIGFDACVRKGLTDGKVRFLTDEQALTLQTINGQRDAAQHYLIDMSEHQLYFYAQAGVTVSGTFTTMSLTNILCLSYLNEYYRCLQRHRRTFRRYSTRRSRKFKGDSWLLAREGEWRPSLRREVWRSWKGL